VDNAFMSLSTILLILAFVAFVLAAIGWGFKKIDFIAIGLALWTLSIVIGDLSPLHLTLPIVLTMLAFVAFVLATVGWKYKKIGLIGVGLALWLASFLYPILFK
jgi:hypothetical protein